MLKSLYYSIKRLFVKQYDRKVTLSIKILLTVFFAIIFASICYFILITALVNPWLENNQRELCVLNFYSQKNPSNASEIYFIGTSQIKEGIDCDLIEDDLNKSNISFTCYNLAVNGDSPLRRLIELDSIIKTKPKMVIVGTDISDIYHSADIEDSRLMLVSNKIILDNTSSELFDNEQRRLLNLNPVSRDLSNRVYIVSYLNYMTINKLLPNSMADYEYRNNFKNPYKNVENTSIEEKMDRINRSTIVNDTMYSNYYGNTTQKLALTYTIQELNKNNIKVIIINMPSDPLKLKYISNSTRTNYFSYFESIGVRHYNFENRYPSNYFHDFTHMNVQGRTNFSHDVAEIITREVEL